MKAVVLPRIAPIEEAPLIETELPTPVPKDDEVLVKVAVCGLCHTDLDEIEGRLMPTVLPVVPGHQVVGTVVQQGPAATVHEIGARVGITWLYSSCQACPFCQSGRENLCDRARWTGKDANGGYAEYMVVRQALSVLNKGGRLVINAIRKVTAVPELIYDRHLWDEKEIKSVANVTRGDAREFLPLAAAIPLRPTVEEVAPEKVNQALLRLKHGKIEAAAALRFSSTDPRGCIVSPHVLP